MVSGISNVSLNWGTLTVELFFNSEKRRMSEQVPPSCKMKKSRIFSAELGLCDPRGASYAPLRMLSNYRQSAGRLEASSDKKIMCSKRLKQIVFTGIPLGGWSPSSDKKIMCSERLKQIVFTAFRWEVGAPAPT